MSGRAAATWLRLCPAISESPDQLPHEQRDQDEYDDNMIPVATDSNEGDHDRCHDGVGDDRADVDRDIGEHGGGQQVEQQEEVDVEEKDPAAGPFYLSQNSCIAEAMLPPTLRSSRARSAATGTRRTVAR